MTEEGKLLLMLIEALGAAPADQKTQDFSMPYPVALWYIQHKDAKESNAKS
jgi:hypothetical protein